MKQIKICGMLLRQLREKCLHLKRGRTSNQKPKFLLKGIRKKINSKRATGNNEDQSRNQ